MWCVSFRAQLQVYTDRGWKVFPIVRNMKKPAIAEWETSASGDLVQCCSWWSHWPTANVGIACGPSGLVVIDVDHHQDRDGSAAWSDLVRADPRIENTLHQVTPTGGQHWFYRDDGSHRCRVGIRDGVDVRAGGGLVLVAPSSIDGRRYTWVEPLQDVAPLPAVLVELLADRPKAVERIDPAVDVAPAGSDVVEYWFGQAVQRLAPGRRNETCYWFACQCRDAGVLLADVERLVWRFLKSTPAGDHPFTLREYVATVRSAYDGSRRDPAKRMF